MSKRFPFQVGEPAYMTILEQVACMVWLATDKTLAELRRYQSLVEQQFKMARDNNCPEKTFENLSAMQDCYAAAVAYQTFGETGMWLAFINTVPRLRR
jgi:hypothetical protein